MILGVFELRVFWSVNVVEFGLLGLLGFLKFY